jgi:hypothetical protein
VSRGGALYHHHQDARSKRGLDVADRDFDAIKPKKTRIAVEILAKPSSSPFSTEGVKFAPPRPRPVVATTNAPPPQQHHQQQQQQQQQRQQKPSLPAPAPPPPPPQQHHHQQLVIQPVQPAPQSQTPAPTQDPNLTKHQAKVINGIKHELDRLQPQPEDTKERGRKLRSQEATRFKSELSAYFPDYDEVIGNDPKEQRTWTKSGAKKFPSLL